MGVVGVLPLMVIIRTPLLRREGVGILGGLRLYGQLFKIPCRKE